MNGSIFIYSMTSFSLVTSKSMLFSFLISSSSVISNTASIYNFLIYVFCFVDLKCCDSANFSSAFGISWSSWNYFYLHPIFSFILTLFSSCTYSDLQFTTFNFSSSLDIISSGCLISETTRFSSLGVGYYFWPFWDSFSVGS